MFWVWQTGTWINLQNRPIILLWARSSNGEGKLFQVGNFKPYFYVLEDEVDKVPNLDGVFVEDKDYIAYDGRKVKKVVCKYPFQVKELRGNFTETFEADILFHERYLIDRGIKYGFKVEDNKLVPYEANEVVMPRICFFDIEVISPPEVFPSPIGVEYPILTIQCLDTYEKDIKVFTLGFKDMDSDYQVNCRSEKELLYRFWKYVDERQFDVLSGWNSNRFDIPYLIRRSNKLGIRIPSKFPSKQAFTSQRGGDWISMIPGYQLIDFCEFFKEWHVPFGDLPSWDLKYVTKTYKIHELGQRDGFDFSILEDYQDLGTKIKRYYEDGLHEDLFRYCVQDVLALYGIELKLEVLRFYEFIRLLSGVPLEKAIKNSNVLEYLLFHEGIKPSPTKRQRKRESYRGAIVLEPEIGLHEWVGVFDFSSLPPEERVLIRRGSEILWVPIGEYEWKQGDETLTWTDDGKVVWRKVKAKLEHDWDGEIVEIRTEHGRVVRVTANHSIFAIPKGKRVRKPILVDAGELKEGDYVVVGQTGVTGLERIKSIRRYHYRGKVYDLSVEETERFFAGHLIGVHNSLYPSIILRDQVAFDIDKTLPRVVEKTLKRRLALKKKIKEGKATEVEKAQEKALKWLVNCLTEDHYVYVLGNGYTPIKDVKIGDRVISIDPVTLKPTIGRVTDVIEMDAPSVLYQVWSPKLPVNFLTTKEHRWFVKRGAKFGFVTTYDLMLQPGVYKIPSPYWMAKGTPKEDVTRGYWVLYDFESLREKVKKFRHRKIGRMTKVNRIEELLMLGGTFPIVTRGKSVDYVEKFVGDVPLYAKPVTNKDYDKVYCLVVDKYHTFYATRFDRIGESEIGMLIPTGNSYYGALAYVNFRWYRKELSEHITARGREMITRVKDFVERKFKYRVVYGDSVTGRMKVYTDRGVMTFDELWKRFSKDVVRIGEKEYVFEPDIRVPCYDVEGDVVKFVKPKYVMRHKCGKRVFRIWFNNHEHIEVTEDHSLLGVGKGGSIREVKPTAIKVGEKLIIGKCNMDKIDDLDWSYVLLGKWIADGCTDGYYVYFSGQPEFIADIGKKLGFTVCVSKNDHDCTLHQGKFSRQFIGRLKELGLDKKKSINVKLPGEMLKELEGDSRKLISFLLGLWQGDGSVVGRQVVFNTASKELAEQVKYLLFRAGFVALVQIEKNGRGNFFKSRDLVTGDMYRVVVRNSKPFIELVKRFDIIWYKNCSEEVSNGSWFGKSTLRGSVVVRSEDRKWYENIRPIRVVKIEEIPYDGYVYDFETEYHNFFVENILVHNTDSVFIKFGKKVDGSELERKINEFLNDRYLKIEFEKLYRSLIFVRKKNEVGAAKKRYAGLIDGTGEVEIKGLEVRRSDAAELTKELVRNVVEMVLKFRFDEAVDYVRKLIGKFDELDIRDIAIPRGVSKLDVERNDPWIEGIRNFEEIFKVRFNMESKPKLIYLKRPFRCICITDDIEELPKGFVIDRDRMIKRVIVSAVEPIFEAVGIPSHTLYGQTTLERWFE